jgi:hypothetical protein
MKGSLGRDDVPSSFAESTKSVMTLNRENRIDQEKAETDKKLITEKKQEVK